MSADSITVSALRGHLAEKAAADEAFRARLLSDPKAAIEEELGLTVPPGFTVEVHEDAAGACHLVLPPPAALGAADLGQAAGDPGGESPDESWDG